MKLLQHNVSVREAVWPEDIDTARDLFREYERWLGIDLCFQQFEQELRDLPGKYRPPQGRLYIANLDGNPVGCIALRALSNDTCEMKRLYLREAARGNGLGQCLIETVISEARSIGYKKMRLDTYPLKMQKAASLYRARGFRIIEPYYDDPDPDVVFMELDL